MSNTNDKLGISNDKLGICLQCRYGFNTETDNINNNPVSCHNLGDKKMSTKMTIYDRNQKAIFVIDQCSGYERKQEHYEVLTESENDHFSYRLKSAAIENLFRIAAQTNSVEELKKIIDLCNNDQSGS